MTLMGYVLVAAYLSIQKPGPLILYDTLEACERQITFTVAGPQTACVQVMSSD